MKISIVVPCYNEEKNIPLILQRFDEVIKKSNIEVILVNNGSTDDSAHVIEELLPQYPFAKTVLVPVNKGYGYGILQGLRSAEGDYIGWTHADMQTDPADVIKAYRYIIKTGNRSVFVKGNRKGRPAFDSFFTWGMSVFETIFFKTPMYDINAQPNIFPRAFFDDWVDPPYDFSLDLYAVYMAHRSGIRLVRFPVCFPERIYGESKWNNEGLKSKWKFIKRTIKFSFELKKRMH
ncbi:MAG: glycosyltransferase family 2 protein [Lachnospiraceae bacterium]|nr:glycosyltransferase family 2 protein [Lachnospiraceae bacterium]